MSKSVDRTPVRLVAPCGSLRGCGLRQAWADAKRAAAAVERLGPAITPGSLRELAAEARRKLRMEDGRYRRDHLRTLAQLVEVGDGEIRIMGSKMELLRTLVAASSVGTAAIGVRSFEPKWCTRGDSNTWPHVAEESQRAAVRKMDGVLARSPSR